MTKKEEQRTANSRFAKAGVQCLIEHLVFK